MRFPPVIWGSQELANCVQGLCPLSADEHTGNHFRPMDLLASISIATLCGERAGPGEWRVTYKYMFLTVCCPHYRYYIIHDDTHTVLQRKVSREAKVNIMPSSLSSIAPYYELHQNARGPDDQRPSAIQIIEDRNLFGKLGHLTIVVTAGNTGLGKETVRALHATGARIIITVAPGSDGALAAREIETSNKDDPRLLEYDIPFRAIESKTMDLGSLANIRSTAAEIKAMTENRVNILICNAGVMNPSFTATEDGFEPHFGINFLGHFLLFNELAGSLARGCAASPSFASRVLILSSLGHRGANVNLYQLPPDTNNASASRANNFYSESKTELLWMANELDHRFGKKGIHGLSVNPGSIATPMTAHIGWDTMRNRMGKDIEEFDRLTKNVEQGAATTVWAAIGPELEGKGALYLDDVQVARPANEGTPLFTHGYAAWAYDDDKASRLWNLVTNLLGDKGYSVASQH